MSKAGFASPAVVIAALLVGVLMGVLGTNLFQSHHPNSPSPLAYSAPQALSSIHDSLAVEAYVDSDGRAQNYRVLSAGKTLPPQTKEHAHFYNLSSGNLYGQTDKRHWPRSNNYWSVWCECITYSAQQRLTCFRVGLQGALPAVKRTHQVR